MKLRSSAVSKKCFTPPERPLARPSNRSWTGCLFQSIRLPVSRLPLSSWKERSVPLAQDSTFEKPSFRETSLQEWDASAKLSWTQWLCSISAAVFLSYILLIVQKAPTKKLLLYTEVCLLFLFSVLCFRQAAVEQIYERRRKDIKQLADVDSKFLTIDKVLVHYKCTRPKSKDLKPAIGIHCFHGFGHNLDCWKDIQQSLADKCGACVTAADLTGFGLTQRPSQTRLYTCLTNGKIGRETLQHEVSGEVPIVLMGHSLGGLVSIVETIRCAEKLAAVILVAPAVTVSEKSEQKPKRSSFRVLRIMLSLLGYFFAVILLRNIARMVFWIVQPVFCFFLSLSIRRKSFWDANVKLAYLQYQDYNALVNRLRFPKMVRGAEWGLIRFTAARFAETAPSRSVQDILLDRPGETLIDRFCKAVKKYNIRVLLIHGEKDRLVPLQNSQRLHSKLANSHLVKYENCGHSPHEEYPEVFVNDVVQFLKDSINSLTD